MKKIVLILSLFLFPSAVQAQNIVSYQTQTFSPGVNVATGTPIQVNDYAVTLVTCNQTKPTVPAVVVNPTKFFFDDVNNAGKVCMANLVSVLLPALPNNKNFLMTIDYTVDTGDKSPRSAASNPFDHLVLSALTGFGVAK